MAKNTFQIFKVTDKELISSLLKISQECGNPEDAAFTLHYGEQAETIQLKVKSILESQFVK